MKYVFLSGKKVKMSSLGVGEMDFDSQIGGWQLLSSSYYCEESELLQINKISI